MTYRLIKQRAAALIRLILMLPLNLAVANTWSQTCNNAFFPMDLGSVFSYDSNNARLHELGQRAPTSLRPTARSSW